VTLSGQDFYLGPHGTKASKIEYDRLIGEWLANGRKVPAKAESTINVVDLCAHCWRFCKTYYVKNGKPTDEQAGVRASIKALKKSYGKTPANEFGPLALESVRNQMIETGNSRRYINQNIGRIKRMFRWGVSKELIQVETYQRLQAVAGLKRGKCKAVETKPILPIADATIAKANSIVADMIRIQRLTGCRPGEVCAMQPPEIDRTNDVWQFWPESHKMEHKNRHRVVLIGPRAQAILKPYLIRAGDGYCFLRRDGNRYETPHYHKHIKGACDRAFPAPDDINDDELRRWQKQHRWPCRQTC